MGGPVLGWGILPYRFTGSRWPSVFAHVTGRNVFKGTAGATRAWRKERRRAKGRKHKKKQQQKKQRVCWPHVTVCTSPGCHAERKVER